MRLYLVRHGKAADEGYRFDEDRPLTNIGRALMRTTAKAWLEHDPKHAPDVWLTSSLVRAVQTCEICVHEFGQDGPVGVKRELVPEAPVSDAAELFDLAAGDSIAVVSHEPLMGELASHLLGFQFPRDFKKGSVLALKRGARGEAAKFVWFLEPAREDKEPKIREEL